LDYSEYLFICERLNNGVSLKDIRAYISFKERQKEDYDAKMAEKNVAENTQMNVQMEEAKTQREIAADDAKTKNLIKVEYFKTLFQGMLAEQGAEQKLQQMGMQMGFDAGQAMSEQAQNPQQQQGVPQGQPPAPPEIPTA